MIDLYLNQKLRPAEIGNKLNAPGDFIKTLLIKHKIPLRNHKEAAAVKFGETPDCEELKQLCLTERKSQNEIAKIYGARQQTISKWLRHYGIKKEIKLKSLKARERRKRS